MIANILLKASKALERLPYHRIGRRNIFDWYTICGKNNKLDRVRQ